MIYNKYKYKILVKYNYHLNERRTMFGFIEREQILLKQNVYDLLHNTRIGRKAFLFIIW